MGHHHSKKTDRQTGKRTTQDKEETGEEKYNLTFPKLPLPSTVRKLKSVALTTSPDCIFGPEGVFFLVGTSPLLNFVLCG